MVNSIEEGSRYRVVLVVADHRNCGRPIGGTCLSDVNTARVRRFMEA